MAERRFAGRERLHRGDRGVSIYGEGFPHLGRDVTRRDGARRAGEGKEPERAKEECGYSRSPRRCRIGQYAGDRAEIIRASGGGDEIPAERNHHRPAQASRVLEWSRPRAGGRGADRVSRRIFSGAAQGAEAGVRALAVLGCAIALACHTGKPEPATGTRVLGAVERSGDSIITRLTIVNELNRARDVGFMKCPPRNTVRLTQVSSVAGAYHGSWDYAVMDS